jgi:hypothetical protein
MPLQLSDSEIVLPLDLAADQTYDVLLNGQHVWSLQPSRDTVRSRGHLTARWPKNLRRYLVGRAEVTVRDHASGTVIGTVTHVFGDAPDQVVSVTDKEGHALILDKYGKLTRPLSAEADDTLQELMDNVERLLEVLARDCGVPAFLAYGTLLGAVRNGKLIGHDNDVDLGYVSDCDHPVDVVRESFRIERTLAAQGWVVRRGSGTRLNVRIRLRDDTMRFIDVFTSHWVEGVYYMPQDTGFRLPREAILPLTTVELLGRELPAPADYERLLAETYGPGWRVPDPSFRYETPRWLSRRIAGWFGGLRAGRKQWDVFYGAHRDLPRRGTKFAGWVDRKFPADHLLVDLGSGNARDAIFFAQRGRPVVAVDYSMGIVTRSAARPKVQALPITFESVNLNDTREVLALGMRLAERDAPVDLYGRFLLHSLEGKGRDNVIRLASMAMRKGGRLLLEFRTLEDAELPHHYPQSQRHFLDPDEIVAAIKARGGRIRHLSAGTGLAPFRGEDPHVCRIVATWTGRRGAA